MIEVSGFCLDICEITTKRLLERRILRGPFSFPDEAARVYAKKVLADVISTLSIVPVVSVVSEFDASSTVVSTPRLYQALLISRFYERDRREVVNDFGSYLAGALAQAKITALETTCQGCLLVSACNEASENYCKAGGDFRPPCEVR